MRGRTLRLCCALLCLWLPWLGAAGAGEELRHIPSLGQSFAFSGDRVIEPESRLLPEDLLPESYGFEPAFQPPDSKLLMPKKPYETPLYSIRGEAEGPSLYVVGGTHGDERAGWYAALLLSRIGIKRGSLHVLPQANRPGCEDGTRDMLAGYDLNRAFPGDREGSAVQQMAYAIIQSIEQAKPVLVVDMHEAAYAAAGYDFLGQKLILGSSEGTEQMVFELLEQGVPAQRPFGLEGPGIRYSLNDAVSNTLGIPSLTIETFRGYPLETRVADQLRILRFILSWYDMI